MSIPVELAGLARKIGEFNYVYVLTVRDDQRPHIVSTHPTWDGDALVMSLGRGSTANAAARRRCATPRCAGERRRRR